ncbi:MAG: Ig-like domain-containing protein [bacterium]|nr:Ig-like domain-containing protein [bacterium]
MNVVGTGTNTKLVTVAQLEERVRIFGTTDGVSFDEWERFDAPGAIHDALPANLAVDTIYTARAFAGTSPANTRRWVKSGGMWSEDATWPGSPWVMTLSLHQPTNTLYGIVWDMAQGVPPVTEGIRAWNATTGVQIDSLNIGESGSSTRGCFISNIQEGNTVDVAPDSANVTVGQTKQLFATANLARKLYFTVCGGVGYGRIDLGANVTGPVWSSNNYAVATVDATGLVTAISVGVCTVSATYTRDGVPFTDSAVITVVATSAPLVRDAGVPAKVHRVEPVGELTAPRAIRTWELFH